MLYILIVIYNKLLLQSDSFLGLCRQNLDESSVFVILDNSTDDAVLMENKTLSNQREFIYIPMGGNKGLSNAYNRALRHIQIDGKNWVLIFDQDTNVPSKYIDILRTNIANTSADILVPIVYDSVGIMSPSKKRGLSFTHSKKITGSTDSCSFINTGMCIKSTVFNFIHYDERLFLDFVDHDFIMQAKKNKLKINIVHELSLHQNFSGVERQSKEQDLARFKIFIKDAVCYYDKYHKGHPLRHLPLLKRCIKLTIQHKALVFLKTYISVCKGA